MDNSFRISVLTSIVVLALGCSTTKVSTPRDYDGSSITLSHGGGFAGTYTTYTLLDNGQLFRIESDTAVAQKSLEPDVAKQIFTNYRVLGLHDMSVESYGNLNYSITHVDDLGKQKLIWERGQDGSDELQLFYRSVMNLIKINNTGRTENPIKADIF